MDTILKKLLFQNINPYKPLVKLGDEVIAGGDAHGIICTFNNQFNVSGYTILNKTTSRFTSNTFLY